MVCPAPRDKVSCVTIWGHFYQLPCKERQNVKHSLSSSLMFLLVCFPLTNFAIWQLRPFCLTMPWSGFMGDTLESDIWRQHVRQLHSLLSQWKLSFEKKWWEIIYHSTLLLSFFLLLSALETGQQHLSYCPIVNSLVDSIWCENETYRLAPWQVLF